MRRLPLRPSPWPIILSDSPASGEDAASSASSVSVANYPQRLAGKRRGCGAVRLVRPRGQLSSATRRQAARMRRRPPRPSPWPIILSDSPASGEDAAPSASSVPVANYPQRLAGKRRGVQAGTSASSVPVANYPQRLAGKRRGCGRRPLRPSPWPIILSDSPASGEDAAPSASSVPVANYPQRLAGKRRGCGAVRFVRPRDQLSSATRRQAARMRRRPLRPSPWPIILSDSPASGEDARRRPPRPSPWPITLSDSPASGEDAAPSASSVPLAELSSATRRQAARMRRLPPRPSPWPIILSDSPASGEDAAPFVRPRGRSPQRLARKRRGCGVSASSVPVANFLSDSPASGEDAASSASSVPVANYPHRLAGKRRGCGVFRLVRLRGQLPSATRRQAAKMRRRPPSVPLATRARGAQSASSVPLANYPQRLAGQRRGCGAVRLVRPLGQLPSPTRRQAARMRRRPPRPSPWPIILSDSPASGEDAAPSASPVPLANYPQRLAGKRRGAGARREVGSTCLSFRQRDMLLRLIGHLEFEGIGPAKLGLAHRRIWCA